MKRIPYTLTLVGTQILCLNLNPTLWKEVYCNIVVSNRQTLLIIVESRMGIDPDRYKKNNIRWDTIDGRKAKIVYPIKSGIGITGVYVDSLWVSGSDVDRFNLYGENLKPENERKVLEVLRTLKFSKK
jgi:hypothetical protein